MWVIWMPFCKKMSIALLDHGVDIASVKYCNQSVYYCLKWCFCGTINMNKMASWYELLSVNFFVFLAQAIFFLSKKRSSKFTLVVYEEVH